MIPPIDINYVADELKRLADELKEAAEDRAGESDTNPLPLLGATAQLFEALRQRHPAGAHLYDEYEDEPQAGGVDITALGDHGIDLLSQLAALASRLNRPRLAQDIEGLALPLAVWLARSDAEIITLYPVVNSAAALANRLAEPRQLAELFLLLREVGTAVSPSVSQETPSADPNRPWPVFLFNKAIVATRSHQPALMEEAFDALVDQLPEEAPEFFREGMEQMDALDYPPEVRSVMEQWFQRCCGQRILH
jgi:hypothetical protein